MKTIYILAIILAVSVVPAAAQLAASHAPTAPTGSPAAAPADLTKAVVKVNGAALTERDVREQMQRLFPYYSMHGGKVPEKYQAEIRQKAIGQIISEELVFQEARRRGMKVPDATMRKVLRSAKARFQSPQEYEGYSKALYGSVAEFERRIRRATLIEQYEHQEIELKSKASDAKVRETYNKYKKAFLRPESAWLQSISVNLPDKPSEEQKKMARKRIDGFLPEARAAKDYNTFGLLAERVSEDEYRINMGDHKWVHLVGLPQEIVTAVNQLQAGQVSNVIEVPIGYIILRLNERRPAKQLTFDEVKAEIRKEIEKAAAQQRWTALQVQLKKSAHIETL